MTNHTWEEGNKCPHPDCTGHIIIDYPDGGCSCHINAPCNRCTSSFLVCDTCGDEEPEDEAPTSYTNLAASLIPKQYTRPSRDLGNGKRIYDYDYDSSSGSTMDYKGKYEGPVTEKDIIDALGDGTFGHRGPVLYGDKERGTFTYTKITD